MYIHKKDIVGNNVCLFPCPQIHNHTAYLLSPFLVTVSLSPFSLSIYMFLSLRLPSASYAYCPVTYLVLGRHL